MAILSKEKKKQLIVEAIKSLPVTKWVSREKGETPFDGQTSDTFEMFVGDTWLYDHVENLCNRLAYRIIESLEQVEHDSVPLSEKQ